MFLIGDQGRQPSGEERRQSPRVQIMENLQGRQIARDVRVSMLEVGLGGFSLETPLPFPVGGVQEFLVTLTDGTTLTIRGRVAHCRQQVGGEHPDVYVAGFSFVDDSPDSEANARLVDHVTSAISFE